MVRIALGLEYDGRRFCGWQSQSSACGVQDALEQALSEIAGERIRVHAAGRTDTGVHALAQVIHFDTSAIRPDGAWVRGTNALLPDSVSVLWACPVGEGFHARFSAQERRYRYILLNHPVRPGLFSGKIGWFHVPLDIELMRQGADFLVGEHDFSAFRASGCQAKSPVKHLRELAITRQGDTLIFDLAANGFLHHMVRNIVGCLVYVGKKRYPPEWIGELLASADRTRAAPTFAPDGLYFSGVTYDPKWDLPRPSRVLHFEF
ncbi:tRNA pseudouridine synthase A [Sulfurimicrobium lacus]|uniref:tRNA pseudouridine synthase A n=1 Tax=Sulfurimicrobium lacus TaxID=2715678 RepID=A0A6F8VAR4_9PROT|nr:tRNA pseudouridine(38-40) synthase TruA [Sulfurimicrobium lacus]BCB26420.1 tRNA pseudouridine synthase A [Sulfurimicrobium lacus]